MPSGQQSTAAQPQLFSQSVQQSGHSLQVAGMAPTVASTVPSQYIQQPSAMPQVGPVTQPGAIQSAVPQPAGGVPQISGLAQLPTLQQVSAFQPVAAVQQVASLLAQPAVIAPAPGLQQPVSVAQPADVAQSSVAAHVAHFQQPSTFPQGGAQLGYPIQQLQPATVNLLAAFDDTSSTSSSSSMSSSGTWLSESPVGLCASFRSLKDVDALLFDT